MKGATVCRMHGGAAKQVRAAAEIRLAALVDPAIGVLYRAMKKSKPDGVALGAAKDVLDRAGYKAPDKLEHTGANGDPVQLMVLYKDAKPDNEQ